MLTRKMCAQARGANPWNLKPPQYSFSHPRRADANDGRYQVEKDVETEKEMKEEIAEEKAEAKPTLNEEVRFPTQYRDTSLIRNTPLI